MVSAQRALAATASQCVCGGNCTVTVKGRIGDTVISTDRSARQVGLDKIAASSPPSRKGGTTSPPPAAPASATGGGIVLMRTTAAAKDARTTGPHH